MTICVKHELLTISDYSIKVYKDLSTISDMEIPYNIDTKKSILFTTFLKLYFLWCLVDIVQCFGDGFLLSVD